jgi:hypothetical protein
MAVTVNVTGKARPSSTSTGKAKELFATASKEYRKLSKLTV